MAFNEALRLVIDADTRGAVQGFDKMGKAADQNLKKGQTGLDKFGSSMTKVGVGMVATGALLVGGMVKAAKASEAAAQSTRKLENSVANNANLAGHSAKEFTDLAEAIQKKTAADADDIIAGQAVLAQGRLSAAQMKELTPLVVDLARKKGIDEVTAFTLASKAAAGNVGALKRSGIQVDETLAKTDAYKATVEALRGSVGGFAEEEGKTFSGSMERLKNQMGDIEEGVGKGAVDAFSSLLKPVGALSDKFRDLDPETQSIIGKFSTFGAVGLIAVGGISAIIGKVITMKENLSAAKEGVGSFVSGLKNSRGALVGVGAGIGVVGIALAAYMDKQSKFKAGVRELREEAEATGDSLEEVGLRKLARSFAESDEVTHSLHRLGMEMSDLKGPLQGSSGDFEAWGKSVRAGTDQTAEAQQAAGILIGRVGQLRDQLGTAKSQQDRTTDAMSALGVQAEGTSGSLDGTTGSLDDATEATKSLGDQTRDLSDALRAQVDPLFAAQDAALNLKEAQDAVATATKEHGSKSAETAAANRDAVRAAAEYETSLLGLQGAVQDGTVSLADAKNTLKRWSEAGYISKDAAAQAAYAFGILSWNAGSVPKAVSTTVSTPGLASAIQGLHTLGGQLSGLQSLWASASSYMQSHPQRGGFGASGGPVQHLAAGGVAGLHPGRPRGVDNVPIWAQNGEWVIRKAAVDKIGPAGMASINQGRLPGVASGGPTTIVLQVDKHELGRVTVDGLSAYNKTNGPIPVKVKG